MSVFIVTNLLVGGQGGAGLRVCMSKQAMTQCGVIRNKGIERRRHRLNKPIIKKKKHRAAYGSVMRSLLCMKDIFISYFPGDSYRSQCGACEIRNQKKYTLFNIFGCSSPQLHKWNTSQPPQRSQRNCLHARKRDESLIKGSHELMPQQTQEKSPALKMALASQQQTII